MRGNVCMGLRDSGAGRGRSLLVAARRGRRIGERDAQHHQRHRVDEYGAVAGLVTTEDMVEEIVGELRDEHEEKMDVMHETNDVYLVKGNLGVDRLYDLYGVSVEGFEATTVGGLVSEIAGRIPQPKEKIEAEGLIFEVVASTDRRIESVRIRRAKAPEQSHPHPHGNGEVARRSK